MTVCQLREYFEHLTSRQSRLSYSPPSTVKVGLDAIQAARHCLPERDTRGLRQQEASAVSRLGAIALHVLEHTGDLTQVWAKLEFDSLHHDQKLELANVFSSEVARDTSEAVRVTLERSAQAGAIVRPESRLGVAVINIEGNFNRKNSMLDLIDQLGVADQTTFFSALDGTKLGREKLAGTAQQLGIHTKLQFDGDSVEGDPVRVKAILLSHLSILADFLENRQESFLLICEDDIGLLSGEEMDSVRSFIHLRDMVDMGFLDASHFFWLEWFQAIGLDPPMPPARLHRVRLGYNEDAFIFGLGAMLYSKEGAKRFLRNY